MEHHWTHPGESWVSVKREGDLCTLICRGQEFGQAVLRSIASPGGKGGLPGFSLTMPRPAMRALYESLHEVAMGGKNAKHP